MVVNNSKEFLIYVFHRLDHLLEFNVWSLYHGTEGTMKSAVLKILFAVGRPWKESMGWNTTFGT
jgi:hypothetical protein